MGKSSDGRLVWNHSTHIDGLIPILERLCRIEGITTVTPA
ncbi:MAG: metal-binding protein, partial [Nostocaceae cyanobacterium]|nr:metal-binding protein [Nostocaceae cyanobacterium]